MYEGPWHTFGYFAHGVPQRLRNLELIATLKALLRTCETAEKEAMKLSQDEKHVPLPPAEALAKPFVAVGGTQLELDFGE